MAQGDDLGGERREELGDLEQAQRPFWRFSTCCGCFLILSLLAAMLSAWGAYTVVDTACPVEPLPIQPIAIDPVRLAELEPKGAALERGETVELSPDDISMLVQKWLSENPDLERAVFRCSAEPDGSIRVQFTMPAPNGWFLEWLLGSRHFNIDLAGHGKIEGGASGTLQFDYFRFGGHESKGGEWDFKAFHKEIEKAEHDAQELAEKLERIELLRIGDGKLEIRLRREPEPPAEAPEPTPK